MVAHEGLIVAPRLPPAPAPAGRAVQCSLQCLGSPSGSGGAGGQVAKGELGEHWEQQQGIVWCSSIGAGSRDAAEGGHVASRVCGPCRFA